MTYRTNHINIPSITNILDEVFNNEVFGINNIEKNFKKWPAVNILENENEFIINMAAPGLTKEDFKIELNEDILTISTDISKEEKESSIKFTIQEFSYNKFSRSFNIPEDLDVDNISAKYENGLLNIFIPKMEIVEEDKKRTINIG